VLGSFLFHHGTKLSEEAGEVEVVLEERLGWIRGDHMAKPV